MSAPFEKKVLLPHENRYAAVLAQALKAKAEREEYEMRNSSKERKYSIDIPVEEDDEE